jgi:hypothetical protein
VRLRSWHVYVIEWSATDIRCKAVDELGIVRTRTNASGGIATAGGGVMHGGCAGAATA